MSSAVNKRTAKIQPQHADDSRPLTLPQFVPSPYFLWKDSVGRCIAAALFVLGLPIMLVTILLVRLTSPGPAIFRQTRVGLNGRPYVMYKIRSMRHNAEAGTGPVWTTTRDPRITRLGRLIRTLHLDEFPQLINVLRGEMALIGPRPERPEFVQKLARDIPGYLNRLAIRPGITGLAQINLPPDTDLDSVRRKLSVDLQYIQHGSVWLDLRIFACTFVRLLGIKGLYASRMFGLDYQPLPHIHPSVPCEASGETWCECGRDGLVAHASMLASGDA